MCRKTFCLVGFLYLVYRASCYRDYNQINHNILLQIQKELQERVLNPGPQNQVSAGTPRGLIQGTSAPLLSILSPKQTPAIQYRQTQRTGKKSIHSTIYFIPPTVPCLFKDIVYTPVTLIPNQQESSRTSRNEEFSKFAPQSGGHFKPSHTRAGMTAEWKLFIYS